MTEKARFPWRVGAVNKTGRPTIVDATGRVVAQMMSGTLRDAERMVRTSNRAAESAGMEEV